MLQLIDLITISGVAVFWVKCWSALTQFNWVDGVSASCSLLSDEGFPLWNIAVLGFEQTRGVSAW